MTDQTEKQTCLIVDDSRIVRKVTRRIVQTIGLDCIEADNGEVALDICLKKLPDVVLLDWQMPKMTGIEFLKKLNKYTTKNNHVMPKVIFCTTINDIKNIREAFKNGASEYIMKPFDTQIMRSKLFFAGVINTP